MTYLRFFTASLILALIAGCRSAPSFGEPRSQPMSSDQVISACREKWEWWDITEAFGLPTVALTPLDQRLISAFLPGTTAYRVTMVNKAFVFGSGPKMKTASCLVKGTNLVFLETDDDVQKAIPQINTTSLNASTVFDLLKVFTMLRGFELQVGLPSKENPWAVVEEDNWYPSFKNTEKQDQNGWVIVISRTHGVWTAEGTLVSPDDLGCYRYTIKVTNNGRFVIQSVEEVFSLGPLI